MRSGRLIPQIFKLPRIRVELPLKAALQIVYHGQVERFSRNISASCGLATTAS